jgi:hypothetical protein
MPYVLTTKQSDERTGPSGEPSRVEFVSRRAVATLEDAQDAVVQELHDLLDEPTHDQERAANTLPASGGTVGPLPDGTIIEVERMLWSSLADEVGAELRWDPPTQDDDYLHAAQREELETVLAAWNEQHD